MVSRRVAERADNRQEQGKQEFFLEHVFLPQPGWSGRFHKAYKVVGEACTTGMTDTMILADSSLAIAGRQIKVSASITERTGNTASAYSLFQGGAVVLRGFSPPLARRGREGFGFMRLPCSLFPIRASERILFSTPSRLLRQG